MRRVGKMLLLAFIVVSGCKGPGETTTLNLLIVAEGEVQLKRVGWQGYHPATFGAALQPGDLLRPAEGAQAIILCADLSAWTAAAGVDSGVNSLCTPSTDGGILKRPGGDISPTRSSYDSSIPYIISPRATKLLSSTPTLRWNAVTGAANYTVQLSGSEFEWDATVSEASVVYSGPPLAPDVVYTLQITSDTGRSSSEEGAVGLGFSVLSQEEAERVRAAISKLDTISPPLPPDAYTFALAQLYAGQDLLAEAIEQLETLVSAGSPAPNVYRTLGELYWRIGLLNLAEARYTRAAELAKAAGDVEAEAAAQAGLGQTLSSLGRVADAIAHLEEARARYETLGDTARANELAARITTLTTTPTP